MPRGRRHVVLMYSCNIFSDKNSQQNINTLFIKAVGRMIPVIMRTTDERTTSGLFRGISGDDVADKRLCVINIYTVPS